MAYLSLAEFKDELSGTQYVQASLATDVQIQAAINRASDEADSYIRAAGYDLPLVAFGDDLRGKVLDIAIYWLASSTLMLNTDDVRTNIAYLNYHSAIRWFKDLVAGHISPDITDSDTSNDDLTLDGVQILGRSPRGW